MVHGATAGGVLSPIGVGTGRGTVGWFSSRADGLELEARCIYQRLYSDAGGEEEEGAAGLCPVDSTWRRTRRFRAGAQTATPANAVQAGIGKGLGRIARRRWRCARHVAGEVHLQC